MNTARALRVLALLIAAVGVFDPAVTTAKRVPVVVSVLGDASTIKRTLGSDFIVSDGLSADAAAVISVGDTVPDEARRVTVPAFAVVSDASGATVRIDAVHLPRRAPVESRVPVTVSVRAHAAAGRIVNVVLKAGRVVMDRASRKLTAADERFELPLSVVPTTAAATPIRVEAAIDGAAPADAAIADELIVADRRSWNVLVYDARPSWMSSFVRRALEDDPRFTLTSRTVTSRAVSTNTPSAPARLIDSTTLDRFDGIVVGAPDALSAQDVVSLEAYLRRRGGAVIALMDSESSPTPVAIDRLTGVSAWTNATTAAPVDLLSRPTDQASLRATETRMPSRLPAGADSLLSRRDRPGESVVWRTAVGAGRLVMSGALDAWRYRAAKTPSFDGFWRDLVAEAAASTPAAITVALDRAVLAPGEKTTARITLTSAALSEKAQLSATIAATMTGPAGSTPIRVWPNGVPGELVASVTAPRESGEYRIAVTSGSETGDAIIVVLANAHHPTPDETDLLKAWTSSRGGTVVAESRLNELPAALDRAINPPRRDQRGYPMRHGWWIAPFAFCLGAEWWFRRRHGRA